MQFHVLRKEQNNLHGKLSRTGGLSKRMWTYHGTAPNYTWRATYGPELKYQCAYGHIFVYFFNETNACFGVCCSVVQEAQH